MIPYFSFEKIGPVNLWGFFLALGFFIPLVFVLKQAGREKISRDLIWNLFLWIIAGSMVGMRLGYILQFPREYLLNPFDIFKFWDGGLTFYGGLFGGIGGMVLFARRNRLNKKEFFKIADLIALYFPLGIIVARTGCFLINDHQGAETFLPWGVIWPDGVVRHPVALYLIISAVIIFLILSFVKDKFKIAGQLFFFFLLIYSLSRFFLDFTRSVGTSMSDPRLFSLTVSQWISLAVFIFALIKILSLKSDR